MTDPKASSGSNSVPGGDTENKADNSTEQKPDKVAYETYQKVLGEKKKRDSELAETRKRLEELERADKERQERELTEKQEFKKLLEIREKEKKALEDEHNNLKTTLANGSKLRGVLDSINGSVGEEYWGLIDLSEVVIDPTTGMPDEATVKKVAREFEKKFPLVIQKSGGSGLPNEAAKGSKEIGFAAEVRAAKTQAQLDAVLVKYGKA